MLDYSLQHFVSEPVLLVLLVLVGDGGDPLVAVPGELLLQWVQQISSGYVAKGTLFSLCDGYLKRFTTIELCVDGTGHILVNGPGGGDDGGLHRLAPGG